MKKTIQSLCFGLIFISCFQLAANSQTRPDDLQLAIRQAVEKVRPSTVKISVYDTIKRLPKSDSFSGVLVSSDGYILTAAHAMKPKTIYHISFPDGNTATATGLGRISSLDAGMLKIRENGSYPFAAMGTSAILKPGVTVVSMGYPFTMDSGILPIVRVGAVKNNTINSYIQSSCLMEPGDSGGPLFNLEGKIVGIHSNILNTDDENFEVPIAIFRQYWTTLLQTGNHTKENLKAVTASETNVSAKAAETDTSLAIVKLQLEKQNSKLKDYSYAIQSDSKEGSLHTNGILISLGKDHKNDKRKSYLLSSSSSIGTNPVVTIKQNPVTAQIIRRDTINDLILLEVHGLGGKIDGVNIYSDPVQFIPGSFALSPIKDKILIGVIGLRPFLPGEKAMHDILPASKILVQDAPLKTEECGGPVFDSQQRFVGLNLRRYNRTSVVIIPHATIQKFIKAQVTDKQAK